MKSRLALLMSLLLLALPTAAFCDDSLLTDLNGDGQIEIAAFGDSITRGVGDFTSPDSDIEFSSTPSGEAGYPLRVETLLGVPVTNLGFSGERLTGTGVQRFASVIPGSSADTVVISGGSNDAVDQQNSTVFFYSLQTMINIARASGKNVMLANIPLTCCNRAGELPYINSFNSRYEQLAGINGLRLAQVYKAFSNTCIDEDCALLNRPEGLHPNIDGYDVQGEAVMAALLNINLFTAEGQQELADALGETVESINTKIDPTP